MSIKQIFIVGWYGTETVGDKAILGGIIEQYQRLMPFVKIAISSLYPFVTRQTLKELDIQADVIPFYSLEFIKFSAISDEVIMGGGPLMDLEVLSIPLWAFSIAKLFNRKRIIWGCGLGPLNQPKYLDAVRKILKLASEVKLRDSASVIWAQQLTGRTDIEQIADPAKEYIILRRVALGYHNKVFTRKILACFLRDWPREYGKSLKNEEYEQIKNDFEANLAKSLANICRKYDLKPVFYAMHSFTVGNDDRVFNRDFISRHLSNLNADYEQMPSSVDEIIRNMLSARFLVCMRFHSVLFAHTLQKDFIAIDYTQGGKISGFLKDNNSLHRCIPLLDLAESRFGGWNNVVSDAFYEDPSS